MTAEEILPGVFLLSDGSARGPGLLAALELAADVRKLDAWTAPALELGWESSGSVCRLLCGDGEQGVVREFAGNGSPDKARRAAVEAIERGEV